MLAERLKECRKIKKVTQKDVAAYLEIGERSYQKYELGTREPNIVTLHKLADYFGVSVDYLIGRADKPIISSETVLSRRLQECRMKMNLTEEDVAKYLGIPTAWYWKYEAALQEPDINELTELADYFKTSVDYLLGRENYWQDSEGNIKVKVPPDILNLDTDELKKKLKKK